jgi:ATP-binding cassette subfamily B protein
LSIAAYNLCTCFIKNYYTERYAPVSDQKIYACIQKLIFQKAGSVELACFENPEFYDKYFKAVSEATGRASQMILSLSNTVNCVFTIASMSFVIFTIDPLLAVFAVLPLIATLLFGKKLNRYRYEYGMEMQEKTRKRTYINRVFYLGDFAKEMRVTNIGMVMFAKLKEAVRESDRNDQKHGFRLASLDYLFLAVNDIVVYLGAIAYAAYKTVVAKTMLYGDCVVVLNTINSVAWSLRSVTELYLEYDNHSMYIDNLRVFLEHESSVSENENGLQVIRGNCDIRLSGVSFRYTQSGPDVLKDINLHIPHNGKMRWSATTARARPLWSS